MAKALRPIFGENVARGYQSRAGGDAPDVDGTPYWVECKKGRRTRIKAALEQGTEATDGRPVLAVCRDDREEPIAALYLKDLLILLEKAYGTASTNSD